MGRGPAPTQQRREDEDRHGWACALWPVQAACMLCGLACLEMPRAGCVTPPRVPRQASWARCRCLLSKRVRQV